MAGTLITIAAVLGWIFLLRPQNLGGPAAYVLVSGESMEPTYETGDFVVAREADSYEIGDVIVYRVPEGNAGAGRLIVHRVIDGDLESGFTTQGDNRDTPDQWRPTEKDVVGKLWFHIPDAASVLPYLRSPVVLAGFFGVLTFLFIVFKDEDEMEEAEPKAEVYLERSRIPEQAAVVSSAAPPPAAASAAAEIVEHDPVPARRRFKRLQVVVVVLAALLGYLLYRRRTS